MNTVVDEKKLDEETSTSRDGASAQDGSPGATVEIDPAKEKVLIRKIDAHVVPLIVLLYLFSFLDRVNIGNARLYHMEKDLGLHGDQFQIAVSILFVTYCLFEVPSNLVIRKLTASRFLAVITGIWGIVATLTGITQNFAGLIACRLILGLAEAGLFPGLVAYMTLFYGRRELALRVGYLLSAAALAGACGGLLAFGIGFMDGVAGQSGWRWIMIIEGIPCMLLAVAVWFLMADDPDTAYFLTAEDRKLVQARRDAEMGQTQSAQQFHMKDAKEGFTDWNIILLCLAQFGTDTVLYGYSTFLPTIINGIGNWSAPQVQALTIPCYATGALSYLVFAWISDRTQHRAAFAIGSCIVVIIGYAILMADAPPGVSYFGCFVVAIGLYVCVGIPLAWLPSNLPRFGKRTYATGLQLTLGNVAGIMVPFVYPNNTAPRYLMGHGVTLAMTAFAAVVYAFMWFRYDRINRRRAAGKDDHLIEGLSEEEIEEMGDLNPRYRYAC